MSDEDFYDKYYNDLYHTPDKFGLEVVAEVELSEPCYSFNIAMVWWHPGQQTFYVAQDSGCSCPSPFEDYNRLERAESLNKQEVVEWLNAFTEEVNHYSLTDNQGKVNVVAAIEKVMSW